MADRKILFRGKLLENSYSWPDKDTFMFQFGDGELFDKTGDSYFIHMEFHIPEKKWITTIFWEYDHAEAGSFDSDEYITPEEVENVKDYIRQIPGIAA